jgi:N4-gp56 family major capsid protein
MASETTSTLSNEMQTYYSSVFLERAKHLLVHREGLQKQTHGKGKGKVMRMNRYTPLSSATTPLTEGTNPSEVSIASTTVDVTVKEYGTTVKVAKLLNLTSIDVDGKEKVELVGQNMGETIDELCRDAIYSGATAQLAGGVSAVTDLATSNTLSATEVRKAVRTLKANKALRYADGYFVGKIGSYTSYDLMGDSAWTNVNVYQKDGKNIYNGEVGMLHGVRFIETTNQKTETSTATVYSNFIHGQKAIGEYELEGDMPKLYMKVPTASDTSNPADRYSTISWAGAYASKVLVSTWVLNVKVGATA